MTEEELREEIREEKIRVVIVEPGKYAREAEIGTELSDFQEVCEGWIQTYYPFDEMVCIVCNDEGKINGMPLNRGIKDSETGEIIDIIAGPFFICDCSTENFGSLSQEQMEQYLEMFRKPERFYQIGGEIIAVPYEPRAKAMER